MATKIFVGSLPSGSKPEELRHLFEAFGVVTECDVMNRCGFVHMEKPEMATTAIKALNGTEFKGETINVEPGRVRDRNQKPGGIGGPKGGGPRPRGGRNPNGMMRMQNFDGMDEAAMGLDGIDERTTKDALQLCSAVFEEMNKLLNPDQMAGPRRGGGGMGFPPNFVEDQLGVVLGGMGGPKGPMNRGPRNNRNNGPPKQGPLPGPGPMQGAPNRGASMKSQAQRSGPPNQGNMNRGPKPNQSGPQGRGPNQGNAGRMQNQGNQGFSGRNQNQNIGIAGRAPKQGNVGPIRNEPARIQRAAAPYNRGPVGPVDNEINFADDVPIVQSARNFANSLATGSQIDRWPANGGNFGGNDGMNRHPMNRNFDEDMPVDNFSDDPPIIINLVTRPSTGGAMGGGGSMGSGGAMGGGGNRRGGIDNQGPVNQGNFGHNTGGGNDRFQGSNDRFQGGNDRFQGGNDRFQGGNNNDRFQNNSNNDRFQGGSGSGMGSGGFGNQDRRGFVLPEKQMFNDTPKFGNQDIRSGGNNSSQFGRQQNNQGSLGGGNRNAGFGNNNSNNNVGRQQNASEGRNIGGGNMGSSAGNAMFTRRNNNSGGNLDGNNMGNNRMRNDVPDTNRGGNFGVNNNRGMGGGGGGSVGNMNANNSGFNRNNNMGGGNSNLNGPIGGNNRNMGGGSANNNNRNMGGNMGGSNNNNNNRNMGGGLGNNNNNNRNMGGGISNNRNMGGNTGSNMDRNNMGGGNQLNFQKDFPALSGGQNMNNRNGPRQNMMSNRRY